MRLERQVLIFHLTELWGSRQGRPTALTQVLFMGAAFCGCLSAPAAIQCVIQNHWWAAPLLVGQEPSLNHVILLVLDSTRWVFLPAETPKQQWPGFLWTGFFNIHFSCSYSLSSLLLVQGMGPTPTFLKNIIYLLFELYTQVSYKWRVTAVRKNKGVCWAVINNKLPRKMHLLPWVLFCFGLAQFPQNFGNHAAIIFSWRKP